MHRYTHPHRSHSRPHHSHSRVRIRQSLRFRFRHLVRPTSIFQVEENRTAIFRETSTGRMNTPKPSKLCCETFDLVARRTHPNFGDNKKTGTPARRNETTEARPAPPCATKIRPRPQARAAGMCIPHTKMGELLGRRTTVARRMLSEMVAHGMCGSRPVKGSACTHGSVESRTTFELSVID